MHQGTIPNEEGTEMLNYFDADEVNFEIVFFIAGSFQLGNLYNFYL